MDDIYKNHEEYNSNKKRKILIVFDNMIADMLSNKKLIRLNSTHYFIMKIPNKRELQQTAFNHSSDITFKDFINLYRKRTAILQNHILFLVINATLASDNPLRFIKNLAERI